MNKKTLQGKTVIVTGGSRGIGRAIALKCAQDGANVVIAAKSVEENGKLPGTIFSVAEEVEQCGGKALALQVDVRDADALEEMAKKSAEKFGGIDVLVNNAGAIYLTSIELTTPKNYDLMQGVNTRATFMATKACLPYLKKSSQAHVLNLSPPLSFKPEWLSGHVAYTISKYGMTMCAIGLAAELADDNISVNALWPRTAIATAAISRLMGEQAFSNCRKTDIMADAAYALFVSSEKISGQALLDEDFLRTQGVSDFAHYACVPGAELLADFYIE